MDQATLERAAQIKLEIDEAQKWINNLTIQPTLCQLSDYCVIAHQHIPSMTAREIMRDATEAAAQRLCWLAMQRIVALKLEAADL